MEPIVIKVGPHIVLKQLQLEDAEVFFGLVEGSRSSLREWMGWVDNIGGVEEAENFIRGSLVAFEERGNLDLGIWYKEQLVGSVGIHDFNKNDKRAALGYWLSREFRGEGIMTESIKGFLEYLFEEVKLNRVEIKAGVLNTKSCAVAERLGFKFEGVARQAEWLYDHFHDLNIYSVLSSEWNLSAGERS